MRDLILQCAGVAGIVVALIHGALGETKVFARATIQAESLRTLIRLVWQTGTVAWIGGGVLLIAAPSFGSESARHWIVVTIVAVYAFAAAANAWWSRGRGFGWKASGRSSSSPWRGTRAFPAKWRPVRIKKTRQIKNSEPRSNFPLGTGL